MLLKKAFIALVLLHGTAAFAVGKEMQEQFAQGVALARAKNYVQAIPIFSKLTKEYPAFPEPYNNLAYIYAMQGNYIKAQEVLELAFKNNPSYALVYENLNMIYARIARDIYEKEIGAEDKGQQPLKNFYLIDQLFDKPENKIAIQNDDSEKNNATNIKNAEMIPASPMGTAPSAYAPPAK
ncbi:MAG: tetratricopeptide repeat protein [Methylobacter sp.]|jgi:tetratricopeptide (TPR) repeat protein|nr:tetratricopeptide repeat protein [Methylobacter sp.]